LTVEGKHKDHAGAQAATGSRPDVPPKLVCIESRSNLAFD
jgi:hypothetical protein